MTTENTPLPLSSLACPFVECERYAQPGSLKLRTWYGSTPRKRLLRCACCGREFSERYGTPLWNCKIPEARFVSMVEHLALGHSPTSITKTCKVHHDTVDRVSRVTAAHAEGWHDTLAVNLEMTALQADERHGFVAGQGEEATPYWEAGTLDPRSKFVVSLRLGVRDATLIEAVLQDSAWRLRNRHDLCLFTDGESSYATLFPSVFGIAYTPPRTGRPGRPPQAHSRIPRTLAHVQIVKHRQGKRLERVEVRQAHGTQTRVNLERERLSYTVANTSATPRYNGTARGHTPHQHRKGLSHARLRRTRLEHAQITRLGYNWVQAHRSLQQLLETPQGRRRSQPRTPAMALGLTCRIWSWSDLLSTPTWAFPMWDHST